MTMFYAICLDLNGTKICGTAKMKCYTETEGSFHNSDELNKCDCLSTCSELVYDAYASTTTFDFGRTLTHTIYNKDFDLER